MQRIYPINALPRAIPICLGKQTEYGARPVSIDIAAWLGKWPDMVASVQPVRPGEVESYLATDVTRDGSIITWTPSSYDTAKPGVGTLEVVGLVEGVKIISATAATSIEVTNTAVSKDPEVDPLATWADSVIMAGEQAKVNADRAAASAEGAAQSEANAAATAEQVLAYTGRAETAAKAAEESAQDAAASAGNAEAIRQQTSAIAEETKESAQETLTAAQDAQTAAEKAATLAGEHEASAETHANRAAEKAESARQYSLGAAQYKSQAGSFAAHSNTYKNAAEAAATAAEDSAATAKAKADAAAADAKAASEHASAADNAADNATDAATTAGNSATKAATSEQAAQGSAMLASAAQIAAEAAADRAEAVKASIPEDYSALAEAVSLKAPAIICEESGEVVSVSDAAEGQLMSVVSHIDAADGVTEVSLTRTGRNILDGLAFARNIAATVTNAEVDEDAKTVKYAASRVSGKVLFEWPFRENARYTIIMTPASDNTAGTPNMRVMYTDGTVSNIAANNMVDGKWVFATSEDTTKTVAYIQGRNSGSTTTLLYEECGVFEGVLTADDFGPYDGVTLTVTLPETVTSGAFDWTTGALTINEDGASRTVQLAPQRLDFLKGYNSLWSSTGATDVRYLADTKLYIDNQIAAIAAAVINA